MPARQEEVSADIDREDMPGAEEKTSSSMDAKKSESASKTAETSAKERKVTPPVWPPTDVDADEDDDVCSPRVHPVQCPVPRFGLT